MKRKIFCIVTSILVGIIATATTLFFSPVIQEFTGRQLIAGIFAAVIYGVFMLCATYCILSYFAKNL